MNKLSISYKKCYRWRNTTLVIEHRSHPTFFLSPRLCTTEFLSNAVTKQIHTDWVVDALSREYTDFISQLRWRKFVHFTGTGESLDAGSDAFRRVFYRHTIHTVCDQVQIYMTLMLLKMTTFSTFRAGRSLGNTFTFSTHSKQFLNHCFYPHANHFFRHSSTMVV